MTKGTMRNLMEKINGKLEDKVSDYLKSSGSDREIEDDLIRLLTIYNYCNDFKMKEIQSGFYSDMSNALSNIDMSKIDASKFQEMMGSNFAKGGN